jgi:hypothetical protein
MNDSFLLFWDVRKYNLLGGYWDTFGDDVTEVKFHPSNPDSIVSPCFLLLLWPRRSLAI